MNATIKGSTTILQCAKAMMILMQPLQACLHKVPIEANQRGSDWPEEWPRRLQTPPYWLNRSQMGIYGKPAPEDFTADYEHWKQVVSKLYLSGLGISWSDVRNIMDMRAVYGGYSQSLKRSMIPRVVLWIKLIEGWCFAGLLQH